MNKLKFLTFCFSCAAPIFLSSCVKMGCTDADANNYDWEAKEDDNTCTYDASVIFWHDLETANNLADAGVITLKFFVDSVEVGTKDVWIECSGGFANCEDACGVTVTTEIGDPKTKPFSYSITNQTGVEFFSGTSEFVGADCVPMQLVY